MKIQWKKLILCILLPLAVGALSGLVSGGGMEAFETMNKPPLSPPAWVFPLVWTILYTLMGISSYLILTSDSEKLNSTSSLNFYFIQLAFNFFWSIFFFSFGWYLFSFIWLVALWVLILITTIKFYGISKPAAYLMLPYLLWVAFAGYLNLSIYFLNKPM